MTNISPKYLFILIVSLTSCATLGPDKFQSGQILVDNQNYQILNGQYLRRALNDASSRNGDDLFWSLFRNGHHHMIKDNNDCVVELQALSSKRIKVTYLKMDSVIETRVMKVRLKHGYFELRRKVLFIPAIYLNIFRTTKFRMGVLENGNLTTDYREVAFGTALVFFPFFGDDRNMDIEFQKVNNKNR